MLGHRILLDNFKISYSIKQKKLFDNLIRKTTMKRNDEIGDEREEFEREVPMDTKFVFPLVISEHNVLGKHLIIAPDQANWLVCDDEEYMAFTFFREGKNAGEVLSELQKLINDRAESVIGSFMVQVLGKGFLADLITTERPLLKMASLCLTAGCNLRCHTCFMGATVAGKDECTFEQWVAFLRAFRNIGGEVATMTGGEPLMNPDCLKIVQYAKSVGLKVVLLTNGTLLTGENAKILCKNCDQIRVSIDGPDAETHDMNRGKGTFESAIAGLRYLADYPECGLSIAMTPTPATIPAFRTGLGKFADWIRQDIRSDIEIRVTGRLMQGRNTPKMSNQEKLTFGRAVRIFYDDQLGDGSMEKLSAINIIPNQRNVSCGMAANVMVFADGGIGICSYSTETVANIKNIQEGSEEHSLSRAVVKLGQIVLSTRVEKLQPCADCDIRYFCGGRCRMEYEGNFCQCEQAFRDGWYERLVRISPYLAEPRKDYNREEVKK